MPSSALPLAYYLVAYAGFAAALLVLVADPSIPGASFYQPRVVALVHLLTLAWLTGSILGSLYIVGPLALGLPMRAEKADWIAFAAFVLGAGGMVAHFWINTYDGMAWSAAFVIGAVTWVGVRVVRGLGGSRIPWAVGLHVVFAFFNILAAAALGIVIGFDRSRGFLPVSPLAAVFAHAHIAAVGWVTMLVIGLSYRLIPMMLPARMPTGRSLAISAILLQLGLAGLTVSLMMNPAAIWFGALMIVGGAVSFAVRIRRMLSRRLPPPPASPARDWSTWQVHSAFIWLLVAVASGLVLSFDAPDGYRLPLMWTYGITGLVGFLAQMVAGMQGRLVPLYAWYRAYARSGAPPSRAAHALPSAAFARSIFLCWAVGVPLLVWGLPRADHVAIRAGAACLLAGVGLGGAYTMYMIRKACPVLMALALASGCATTGRAPEALERERPAAGRQAALAAAPVDRGCPRSADQSLASAIRSFDVRVRALLIEGCRQSPTLRQLAEAIGRTDGVVYIAVGSCPLRSLRGCLLHTIADTGNARYLWIRLNINADWRELAGTMAHELHHALEVLSRHSLRSGQDLLDFYRSVESQAFGDTTLASPYRSYETAAAIDAARAVRSELANSSGAMAADDRD